MIPLLQPGGSWPACVCSNSFERIRSRKSDLLFKEVLSLQEYWFLHNKEAWEPNNPLSCSSQWRFYTSTSWNYDQKWFCDWSFGIICLLLLPVYTKCLCHRNDRLTTERSYLWKIFFYLHGVLLMRRRSKAIQGRWQGLLASRKASFGETPERH